MDPKALRQAYNEHLDFVILYVMMPGMDRWEPAVRLREMSDLLIIILTGKSAGANKLRGFHLGVDDYVAKSFSFTELSTRLLNVLARARVSYPANETYSPLGTC